MKIRLRFHLVNEMHIPLRVIRVTGLNTLKIGSFKLIT